MASIQARVTLKSVNGLAEDNCVNTFAVRNVTIQEQDADLAGCFANFYNGVQVESGQSVGQYINGSIQRVGGLMVELRDITAAPGTPPYTSLTGDLDANPTTPSLPQECAICSSLIGSSSTGNAGRNRGRVYIGPLSAAAATTTSGVARPSSSVVQTIVGATGTLAAELALMGYELGVWSRVDNAVKEVLGGWVDDEFDTQRRRGRKRTTRVFWNLGI